MGPYGGQSRLRSCDLIRGLLAVPWRLHQSSHLLYMVMQWYLIHPERHRQGSPLWHVGYISTSWPSFFQGKSEADTRYAKEFRIGFFTPSGHGASGQRWMAIRSWYRSFRSPQSLCPSSLHRLNTCAASCCVFTQFRVYSVSFVGLAFLAFFDRWGGGFYLHYYTVDNTQLVLYILVISILPCMPRLARSP